MKLALLLNKVNIENIIGDTNIEIEYLSHNSLDIIPNSLFFCIKGFNSDGHKYAVDATKKGAVAIVTEKELDISITQIIVKNTRKAMSIISQNFYRNPNLYLKTIAVTGTNGKTSTCCILQQLLTYVGKKAGYIGTNGIYIMDNHYDCDLTTPDPIILNKTLREMLDVGIEYVVFEASAHAIALNKLDGMIIDIVVLTNITTDHLDFFINEENYIAAKYKLFSDKFAKNAVINVDDKHGLELLNKINIPIFTYGTENPSDCFAINYMDTNNGSSYVVNINDNILYIKHKLYGKFNMYNCMAAICCYYLLGLNLNQLQPAVNNLHVIEGRNNIIYYKGIRIIIDFAHTSDGMKKILEFAYNTKKRKLLTVFGCGGNRDKTKRAEMGEMAEKYSDLIIITEDNNRNELFSDIVADIIQGMNKKYKVIESRKEAILVAIGLCKPDDTIALLGKGNENIIERNDGYISHNDMNFILNLKGN